MKKLVLLSVAAFLVALIPSGAFAGFAQFGNGDFETGDLSYWSHTGDVGITNTEIGDVLSGNYSAYLTTSSSAVGSMCSFLWSGMALPQYVPKWVDVSFKVRYKTNETPASAAQFYDDPFHAALDTGNGTIDLVSIRTNGINPGPGATITRMDTNALLPSPPTVPPFITGTLYSYETPTLLVKSRVAYSSCNPVYVKFSVCNWVDNEVTSAGYVDDVTISFVTGSTVPGAGGAPVPCSGPALDAVPVPTR